MKVGNLTLKKDGCNRLILNLKDLNQYTEYNHFKMHSLQEILKLVTPLCKVSSLDIKNAYYSISVDESLRKYLKFCWKDELYQFCVLLNNLSPYPCWFTKFLKPPLAEEEKSLIVYQPTKMMLFFR